MYGAGLASASRVASVVDTTESMAAAGQDSLSLTSVAQIFSSIGGCRAARDPVRSLETEVSPLPLLGRLFLYGVRVTSLHVGKIRLDLLSHLSVGGRPGVNRVIAPQRSGQRRFLIRGLNPLLPDPYHAVAAQYTEVGDSPNEESIPDVVPKGMNRVAKTWQITL
jgi:hypothetical protein